MPRMKPDFLAEFLEQPFVGVIATLRQDGMPYTVPIWWLWNPGEEAFWLTGTTNRVWCQQLQKNPRASLCIESGPPMTGHVGVDGHCEAFLPEDFDIWPISRQLAEKYVGRNDPANAEAVGAFFDNMRTEPRMLFKFTPQVWRAIDMRVYRGKRADRDFQAQSASPG